jgi:hypothetical protein
VVAMLTLLSNFDTRRFFDTRVFKMNMVPSKGACMLERHLLKKLVESQRKTESSLMAD